MNLLHEHIESMVAGAERRMPRVTYRERRTDWNRRDRFDAVMTGADAAFWDRSIPVAERHDAEQEVPVFEAVRRACALPAATPAQRWAVIERALRELAFTYSEEC